MSLKVLEGHVIDWGDDKGIIRAPDAAEKAAYAEVASLQEQLVKARSDLAASITARDMLSRRLSLETQANRLAQEQLDRYRYAVAFASADAWDNGIDMRWRFEWARILDPGGYLPDDKLAEVGKAYLATESNMKDFLGGR
jgi:hypothetical protein